MSESAKEKIERLGDIKGPCPHDKPAPFEVCGLCFNALRDEALAVIEQNKRLTEENKTGDRLLAIASRDIGRLTETVKENKRLKREIARLKEDDDGCVQL